MELGKRFDLGTNIEPTAATPGRAAWLMKDTVPARAIQWPNNEH